MSARRPRQLRLGDRNIDRSVSDRCHNSTADEIELCIRIKEIDLDHAVHSGNGEVAAAAVDHQVAIPRHLDHIIDLERQADEAFWEFFCGPFQVCLVVRADACDRRFADTFLEDEAGHLGKLIQICLGRSIKLYDCVDLHLILVPAFDLYRTLRGSGQRKRAAGPKVEGIGFISCAFYQLLR